MITSAAVKIFDLKQNKEICLPCHRHCDIFYILKECGYRKLIDYKEIEQGFLDEEGNFYNRINAWKEACRCNQIKIIDSQPHELYSEDLW